MPFCHLEIRARKRPDAAYPANPTTLGEHLRKRRLELGLLQKDVAVMVGADPATVTNWELNRTEPDLRFLPALLALLGSDPRPEGETFGDRLRRARTAKGMSYRELARLLRVDESTVWKWETDRCAPGVKLAPRIREFLQAIEIYLREPI